MNPNDSGVNNGTNIFTNNNPAPQTPVPGSLNFVPPTIESAGEIPTIASSPEVAPQAPENKVEKLPSLESYKIPQPQYEEPLSNKPIYTPTPVTPSNQRPAIVDTTRDVTKLHSLKSTNDSLTQLADLEEQKFISDVEAVHGHK